MSVKELFKSELNIINIGNPSFTEDYAAQNLKHTHLDWRPPAGGKPILISALKKLKSHQSVIDDANEKVIAAVKQAEAKLIGIDKAINVIDGMTKTTIYHSGPPIEFKRMAGPMQGAVIGALLYEGLAKTKDEAMALAESGKITFDSAHNQQGVGPMAGIISASMPVHILSNPVHNNKAYCTVNEGLGKVLRYGAYSEEVLNRLRFIENTFMPVLNDALKITEGVDIKSIVTQSLHMGDECHNRNKASSSLFLREIASAILSTNHNDSDKKETLDFIKNNEHYFLNLSMPYAKLALDAARAIENSSIVVAMARNGVDFGIQMASSEAWFTHEANYVKGLMFPGFQESDAARDIGDSAITETFGIGGFAMGGAPAIVQFVGGAVEQAFNYSKEMHEITHGKHQVFTLPPLDFMPTALGIDVIKVIETGILPIINTGMAHKEAGIGQVGAGLVTPPMECFETALLHLAQKIGGRQ